MINLLFAVAKSDFEIPTTDVTQSSFQGILQVVFGIAGAVALIMIILAAFKYVISQGNPGETTKAKNGIIYASVGLAVCILAFSIVTFVSSRI